MRVLQGLLPHSGPQVTMAMKTKKERFHVGALNRDLKGEMSRERRRRRGATPNSSILQAIRWETKCTEGGKTCYKELEKLPITTHW